MSIAWLSLGSNLNDPYNQVLTAIRELNQHEAIKVCAQSSLYKTKAWGEKKQPDFINAVLKIETKLEPYELLDYCQQLENIHKRVRNKPWGARTLDIDILMYEDKIINSKQLTIPHPYMHKRAFVLVPLAEIAAEVQVPKHAKTVAELLQKVEVEGVRPLH